MSIILRSNQRGRDGRARDKLLITSDAYLHIVGDTRGYIAIRGVCFFLLRPRVVGFVAMDNICLTERLNALTRKICNKLRATHATRLNCDFHFVKHLATSTDTIFYTRSFD